MVIYTGPDWYQFKQKIETRIGGIVDDVKAEVFAEFMTLGNDITDVQMDVSDLGAQTTGIQTQVTDMQVDVTGLQTQVTDMQVDVTELEAQVTGIQTQVTDMQVDITGLETQVTSIQTQVTDITKHGDVKASFIAVDHDGWILLDGRATASLGSNQQANATALGFGSNIPNAQDAYLSHGGVIGTLSGSNNTLLTRDQLPNFNLSGTTGTNNVGHTHSGTTSSNGSHDHNINYRSEVFVQGGGTGTRHLLSGSTTDTNTTGIVANGNHTHTITTGTENQTHTHSMTTESLNGGVSQSALNLKPLTLHMRYFIYLGI